MRGNNNNKDDNGELIIITPKKRKKKVKKKVVKSKKNGTKLVAGGIKGDKGGSGRGLTLKQENFCRELLKSGSQSGAYIASYNAGGMLKATISNRAYILARTPPIVARLEELRAEIDKKWAASKEKTIKRLMQVQEFDIRGLYNDDGKLIPPHKLSDAAARGIAGVRYDKEGNLLEYKIIDIKGCAELLGRHLRLFADKVEVDVNVTHKMSDDELAQRIMRIEQSVQRIAAGGDVPRIASQPEIMVIEAEFTTREDYLRNIIDNTKITGNDLRDAQAALLELDEINKQKE